MFSFFTQKKLRVSNPSALGTGCGSCKGRAHCKSPNMQPVVKGDGEVDILFIKDNVSLKEDNNNKAFIGGDIKELEGVFKNVGYPLTNYAMCYAVACHSKDDKQHKANVHHCYKKVWVAIDKYKPKVVVPMGVNGIRTLLYDRWWNGDKFGEYNTMWIGWSIPDQRLGCWVTPIYDPNYVRRESEKNPVMDVLFYQQVQNIVDVLHTPFHRSKKEKVNVLTRNDDVEAQIRKLIDGTYGYVHAIDFETTGLKPYNDMHDITCIGVGSSVNEANVFSIKTPMNNKLIKAFMADNRHKKIAHNLPFEDTWFATIYKTQINGWVWDTRIVAHALNNQKGITGLKFQAYVNLGMEDYSTHLDQYLRPTDADVALFGDNAMNAIRTAPLNDVMYYCGIDCIATHRLFLLQKEQIGLEELWELR